MKPTLLNAWSARVRELVAIEFPDFSELGSRNPASARGPIRFQWRPSPDLICAMVFRPLDEGFDAFVGWSKDGKYPYPRALDPANGTTDPLEFTAPMAMFLTIVLANRQGAGFWNFWQPEDSLIDDPVEFGRRYAQYFLLTADPAGARQAVEDPVRQAISEIRQFGIPYLQRRIAAPSPDAAVRQSGTEGIP